MPDSWIVGSNVQNHTNKFFFFFKLDILGCQLDHSSSSSLKGPPGFSAGRGAPAGDDPDNGLLQHARPHVGQVHLQLGGDKGEANLEVRVPLEAGSAETHPAIEAGPAVAE